MAIKKKLVCFKTQANFDARLAAGDISEYSIVFIKDTQKIWTHGTYFSSLKELMELLAKKQGTLKAGDNIEIGEDLTIKAKDTTYTLSMGSGDKADYVQLKDQDGTMVSEIDLSKFLDDTDTTYQLSLDGNTLKLTPSKGNPTTVDLSKYLDNTDTTYTMSLDGNILKLTPSTGDSVTVDLSKYLDNVDTKNTAGALKAAGKLFLIGASTQSTNPETNSSDAYVEDGKVFDGDGKELATVEAVDGVKNSIEQLRRELDITATTTTYCFMVRNYGDADPTAKEFIGDQANIKNVGKHLRMAAIKKQGDYNFLAENRVTKAVDGSAVAIDGSDGDIMCATDTKVYIYAEKIEASDGALEIFGVGLVPLTLFGKDAVGYDPFAMACDAATYAQLTATNTDHLEEADARAQLHSIYNPNVVGQYTAPRAYFKTAYKANGAGYAHGNYTTLNEILHAQAKNADPNTNYPYLGLYYRFVEIWMAAAKCEFGTMDISAIDKLGAGATSTSAASAATFDDAAISGCSGTKIILANGTVKAHTSIYDSAIKIGSGTAEPAIFGLDSTTYGCSLLPAMTPHRVIDAIVAQGNINYIGDSTKVFNEDGTIAEGVNVSTGEGMVEAQRYYKVRGCTGVESFEDGVMTGVVNCYIMQKFNDNVLYSDGTSLTGGKAIFKLSTLLYRGFTWSTGHWIWMQGFHYVIHTEADGNTRYVTCLYQRDPKQIKPWKSGLTYTGLETAGDTDYEKGYMKDDTHLSYDAFWAKNSNPSISLFCYPNSGGNQHTHVCAYTWRNQSWSGNLNAGYKSVNASAFGGSGPYTFASAGSLSGHYSVAYSNPYYAASFALLDFMEDKAN